MSKIYFFLLFLFVGFLFFYNLGGTYLTHWDEAWYADISRTMLKTGNLLTPIWNTEPFFLKPPLYFWLSAFFMKLFGISEFTVRLPSVLAALATVGFVYLFGSLVFNRYIGLLGSFILSSAPIFLYRGRTGNIDVLLTFFMFFSIFSFYKGYTEDKRWYLIFGAALVLGFLTKGLVGFYPFLIVLLFLLYAKELKVVFSKKFLLGILFAVSIGSGWILLSYLVNGSEFIKQFLYGNVEKFGLGYQSSVAFSLEYFLHLKSGLKFWFIPLPLAFLYMFSNRKEKRIILLGLFSVVFLLVMSFSAEKSNWYILPIYPALALLIGVTLHNFWKIFFGEKFLPFLILFVFAIALAQVFLYKKDYITPDIAGDEARVALAAKKHTVEGNALYMTNYYFPTIVYYSERKTFAVYSEQEQNAAWWIKPKSSWKEILNGSDVTIITTVDEFADLKKVDANANFVILYQSGNKLLVRKL